MAFAWIEQKRQYRRYQARIAQLPPSYRTAVGGVERYLNHLGGMGDAGAILAMLDDLAELFERAAADGTPVRTVMGEDPVEFVETFVRNYPAGSWIVREQERLRRTTEAAEALTGHEGRTA